MIKLYSKNNCPQCKMTKRYLDEHNVEYKYINIDECEQAREHLRGLSVMSVPYVENGDDSWQGFRPDKLRDLL